ncbi:MAG: hypothetical protein H6829_04685 [Planctomycetes bacterium]|nr:hypothetical protein [Planctomycetota bacterium]MCB9912486.1 hypothetical protein [Planctomycetota bacterium]
MTYSNAEVQAELTHWNVLKVDGDEHPDMVGYLGVPGFPSTVLYSAKGARLQSVPGFLGPEPMIELLQSARKAAAR